MNRSPTLRTRLLEALEQAPADTRDLADRFDTSCDHIRRVMRDLVQVGVVRVVDRKSNVKGNPSPINVWGLAPKEHA